MDQSNAGWRKIEIYTWHSEEEMFVERREWAHHVLPQLRRWALCLWLYIYDFRVKDILSCEEGTIVVALLDSQALLRDTTIVETLRALQLRNVYSVIYIRNAQQVGEDILGQLGVKSATQPRTMKEFSQWLGEEIKSAIGQLFPDHLQIAWQQWQMASKEQRAANFQRHFATYQGQWVDFSDTILQRLWQYVEDDSREMLAVLGKEGTGKSAVLAKFYRQLQEREKNRAVIAYFVGASPGSNSRTILLRTICQQFRELTRADWEIPPCDELVKRKWIKLLRNAIVIIDGVDQLNDEKLAWLPKKLPAGTKLIVSTTRGMVHLVNKTSLRLRIERHTKSSSTMFTTFVETAIRYYWERSIDFFSQLAHRDFRYVRLALQYLQELASEVDIEQTVVHFPAQLRELFCQFIELLERRYGHDLVMTLLCVLRSTRYGLTERELSEILLEVDGEDAMAVVYRFRDYLSWAERGLKVSSLALSEAIAERYFASEDALHWHGFIAAYLRIYFDHSKDIELQQELLWQIGQARHWDGMVEVCSDLKFLQAVAEVADPQFCEAYKVALEVTPQEFRDEILCTIAHSDIDVRIQAIELLASQFIAELINALSQQDEVVQEYASQALVEIAPRAVVPLIAALSHDDHQVKIQAAEILGEMPRIDIDESAIAALMKALDDDDWMVRAYTAKALGNVASGASQAIYALQKVLSDEEPEAGKCAADALCKIATHKAVTVLKKALDYPLGRVKVNAALALKKNGSMANQAIPALLRNLHDTEEEVRKSAIEALGHIASPGDHKTITGLLHAICEENAEIQKSTARSLLKILPRYTWALPIATALEEALAFDKDIARFLAKSLRDNPVISPWNKALKRIKESYPDL